MGNKKMALWEYYSSTVIPSLNKGLILSFKIIIPSALLGILVGILVGVGRALAPKWFRKFLEAYVALFRGTPLVIQLMFIHYGLPNLAFIFRKFLANSDFSLFIYFNQYFVEYQMWRWVQFEPYTSAVLSFVLCSGAYQSEYIRGAILSIKDGQIKGAQSLGFNKFQTFINIILPQALRRALPGCGNEIIYLIKYSSLAFVVSALEITGEAYGIAAYGLKHIEVYSLLAVYYLLLVTMATFILKQIENRITIPGFIKS